MLQNFESLKERISELKQSNVITQELAEELLLKNEADKKCRANMIWFCFFEPYFAGQDGIERFFRFWGGEALYNSHGELSWTGEKLIEIGIPCVIKAIVPMQGLQDSYLPDNALISSYLQAIGHHISPSTEHEGFSVKPIPVQNILGISEYPSSDFRALTKCDTWDSSLISQKE